MKPGDLLKECLFPFTSATVLMAIIGFGGLFWVAYAGKILGLWLAFILVPAVIRYAVYLLEARAHGKETLVAGIEIFNIADNFWGLFPLILLSGFAWLEWFLVTNVSPLLAALVLGVFFLVYPASLAVLGITRSPLASVNPKMMYRMIVACGVDYVWIPVVLFLLLALAALVVSSGQPTLIVIVIALYIFFLMFTLTGAVLSANEIAAQVGIEAPLEKSPETLQGDLLAERQRIANHAYGFISRGNRDGGFNHIRQWLASETDLDGAVLWFFNEMMRWEKKDPALFFGQECLAHFLHHERDAMALKLVSRCLHEDPQWLPKSEDRQHAIELAQRFGRDDLLRSLQR
jgi:hypothetical protein